MQWQRASRRDKGGDWGWHLVAAAVAVAAAAGEGRDVPLRENILRVDNIVLSPFKIVVCLVEFWEYFLNVCQLLPCLNFEKVRQESLFSWFLAYFFLHSNSLPLFYSMLSFKARDGMGNSMPSWRTFGGFLEILAYKRGWLMGESVPFVWT